MDCGPSDTIVDAWVLYYENSPSHKFEPIAFSSVSSSKYKLCNVAICYLSLSVPRPDIPGLADGYARSLMLTVKNQGYFAQ